ncbi:helix-turn-helix domain-containing protein [Empedobacter brevis]
MKPLYFSLFLFSLGSLNSLFGQQGNDFSYLIEKSYYLMYNDPKRSLEFSQDFIQINKTSDNQILYQNNIAKAYILQANFSQAVKSYSNVSEIIKGKRSSFYDLFLKYSLAELYQSLDLYSQSQEIITTTLKENKNLHHEKNELIKAKLYRIKAINNGILKNYNEAFYDLKQSNSFLNTNSLQSEILRIENEIYRGTLLLNTKKYTEADQLYTALLKNKIILKYTYIYASIQEHLARVKFLQQKPKESITLVQSGLHKIENKGFEKLNLDMYKLLSEAYLADNNIEEYRKYDLLYNESEDNITKDKRLAISYLVTVLESVNQEEIKFSKKEYSEKLYTFIIPISLLILFLSIVFYFMKKREKELDKQFLFFEKFSIKSTTSNNRKFSPSTLDNLKSKPLLSSETENILLDKLKLFEESEMYLSKQMSLSALAVNLDTNIKYLSEIIKNSKNKKFNAYINDLRIQYIINKLKTDPVYLNYKVSYLAEVTGFSSHSAFTAVFKSITGMSPNDFIKQINEQKNN